MTIDHDGNEDKNVDDELDKDGDDRHHSFVIAIGHVMSGHNDGVSKSVAFVETQTHQFYFWNSPRVASSVHWNEMES